MLVRLWALLSGLDGPSKRALPIGEFLHPVSLAALALLATNDHLLKGSGLLPGVVTGKLSDFAGLAFFPLLCTALVDLVLFGAARLVPSARIDFSLRRFKTYAAVAATGIGFSAIKLNQAAAERVADWLSMTGWPATIVCDPTDLVALIALVVPVWIAREERHRVPLGRLEVLKRRAPQTTDVLEAELSDVGNREIVVKLAAAVATFQSTGATELLDNTLTEIRFGTKRASGGGID